jgi:arylsulfatase A-like enzyme
MPTIADLLHLKLTSQTDGVSMLPTLLNRGNQKQHDHLYWEFHELGGRLALRQGDWKLIQYNVGNKPEGSFELYNLKQDPAEEHDLASKFPDRIAELKKIMLSERTPSDIFKFASEKYDAEITK